MGGDPEDAFDVIVPSLPGFGFSTPVGKGDMNFWKIAELFHTLMTKILGHSKYAAAGADYGALVTGQLGHKYADALYEYISVTTFAESVSGGAAVGSHRGADDPRGCAGPVAC
jgi:pimeloyl-ACP methyl ester carboxylesterase